MRVATHPKVFRKPLTPAQALSFLRALLASPNFELLLHTDRHYEVLAETTRACRDVRGNAFHDVHTAVLMREHGIRRIVTRDAGFRRFSFLEVVDPLKVRT